MKRYRMDLQGSDPAGKDQDWIACRTAWPFFFELASYKKIMTGLQDDVDFLSSQKMIDYSLNVYELSAMATIDTPVSYFPGHLRFELGAIKELVQQVSPLLRSGGEGCSGAVIRSPSQPLIRSCPSLTDRF